MVCLAPASTPGCCAAWTRRLNVLHRDQQGTISIISVFAVMLLTMLLGMLMNVGRQVDGKIRMQNSADAVAYSGGVVLARGMNTLAFTNHLLCDVFALTAFMREARDRNAESFVPEILAAWATVGPVFSSSGFPKFERLGSAIVQKVPMEQEMVTAYGEWAAASSELVLPMMEAILAEELIPKYQRSVVEAFPDIAQTAAMDMARRGGVPDLGRGDMLGVLWRTSAQPVGGEYETYDPTFPVVDPVMDAVADQDKYLSIARGQRKQLSRKYLGDWNRQAMCVFDREAKMCQYSALWRSFTCGQLNHLLEVEYPDSNLPHVIRTRPDEMVDAGGHLDQYFTFVGVVYWRKLPEMMPGLFKNPTDSDAVAYAEVRVFVPQRRLVWRLFRGGKPRIPLGGVPGNFLHFPEDDQEPDPVDYEGQWVVARQSVPTHWDLLNQHWTCQLVPATGPNLAEILQTVPPVPEFGDGEIVLPDLGELSTEDIGRISPH